MDNPCITVHTVFELYCHFLSLLFRLRGGWVCQQQSEHCSDLENRTEKWTIPKLCWILLIYRWETNFLLPFFFKSCQCKIIQHFPLTLVAEFYLVRFPISSGSERSRLAPRYKQRRLTREPIWGGNSVSRLPARFKTWNVQEQNYTHDNFNLSIFNYVVVRLVDIVQK